MSSEFDLISRYFTRKSPNALLGVGDDCALLQPSPGMALAVTTDMLVADTHFFADTDAQALGWKALAVSLSDCAAMGARPRWALLAGALPNADDAWLTAFSSGLFDLAGRFNVDLVGGDTTHGPLNLCLTVIGEVRPGQALRRDGAQAGDELWISGYPGCAALGLACLKGEIALDDAAKDLCLSALHRPQPRVDLGLALLGVASAAIDVSDGLLADLDHILERSHCGAELQAAALPRLPALCSVAEDRFLQAALAGGDDYELLFAAPPAQHDAVLAAGKQTGIAVTRIGRIVSGAAPALVHNADGRLLSLEQRGYDHFSR